MGIDRKKFWDPAFFLMFSMDLFLTLSATTSLFNSEVLNLLTSQMCYCDPLVLFENIVNYLLFSRFWTQHLMISSPLFNPGSIHFCVCYCTWQPSIGYSVLQRLLEISAKCLLINAVPSSPSSFAGYSVCPTASNKCCSIGGQGVRL